MSHSSSGKEREAVEVGEEAGGRVAILLCTYQGEQYLVAQLDSIIGQTYDNWVVYVSDDGSQDRTLDILHSYQEKIGADRFFMFSGPREGYAQNFISLVKQKEIKADYYAFCDQDDIWATQKLDVAITWIKQNAIITPSLYCGRTALINEEGVEIGHSPLFKHPPAFKNALVQSIAGGNTMVFNQALRSIAASAPDCEIISHDWWFYILVTACGGQVFYDAKSYVSYRQHSDNVIGANSSIFSSLPRFKKMLEGRLVEWNRCNLRGIGLLKKYMPPANLETLNYFDRARHSSLFERYLFFKRSGVYRQTLRGNVALLIAVLIKKI